ncbi:Conserved oligomeric Golgi complex subunit [Rhizina undulata]
MDHPSKEVSYIDYETILSPSFSPHAFANTLITNTNDPSDPTLDLSTPLSRVLFDLQEIDTHVHTLTTTASLPLLEYTKSTHDASVRILSTIESQAATLNATYRRLEKDLLHRSTAAEEVVTAVSRLHEVTSLLRELGRALVLARQLEIQMSEVSKCRPPSTAPGGPPGGGDWKAMVRAAYTLLELRKCFQSPATASLSLVTSLQSTVVVPAEAALLSKSKDALLNFAAHSLPSNSTSLFSAALLNSPGAMEEMRARTSAAASTLHLLSGDGTLLTSAIQSYLNSQITQSLASLARSLTSLTLLDRTLSEVSVRCRNLLELSDILASVSLPSSSPGEEKKESLLDPLILFALDTPSLAASYFRSIAAGLEPRVREVVARGGANARILRGSRERVRAGVAVCVLRGLGAEEGDGKGEFEVAVMVGAFAGLGR